MLKNQEEIFGFIGESSALKEAQSVHHKNNEIPLYSSSKLSIRMNFPTTGEKSAFKKIFMPSKFVGAQNRLPFDSV
jgi:hypothetical protein